MTFSLSRAYLPHTNCVGLRLCPKRHPRIDRDLLKEGPELFLACEMDGRAARTGTMELGDESYD